MENTTARRAGIALGAVLLAGSLAAGTAQAARTPETAPRATTVTTAPATDAVHLVTERGHVLEGYAEVGGVPVTLTVYENSTHGNFAQVVLGDLEQDGAIGSVEQTDPFIVDGQLDLTLEVGGSPFELHGTVTPVGKAERLTEALQDNGEQVVSRGTHRQLDVDVTATYAGNSGAVSFAPAFAYDLTTRRVALYGSGR
jgi:hypothetical protein